MVAGAVVLAAAAFVTYFNFTFPDVDAAPTITVERTAERLARGKYLAHHVTVCIDCHSRRDWTKFSSPVIPGTGGEEFPEAIGTLVSPNITPAAIAQYTDGELLRAFTVGVTRDGRAMFPLMPYPMYSTLTEEDAHTLVAYIKSLSPIDNKVKESTLTFLLNLLVKTIPRGSFNPSPEPDKNNAVEYGKYLTTIAACEACHTARDDRVRTFRA